MNYEDFEKINNMYKAKGLRCYKIQCRDGTVYFSNTLEYYDSVANVVEKVVKGEYCLVNPQKLRRTKYFKEQYPTDSIN